MLKRVDMLIINDSEARELSHEANLVKAARALRAMGPCTVVIKRGEHGVLMTCSGKGEFFAAPAMPLEEVFDPTGAGDTFAGGFMGYLAACGEITDAAMARAIIYGSTLASFAVEDFSIDRLLRLTQGRDRGTLPPLQAADLLRRGLAGPQRAAPGAAAAVRRARPPTGRDQAVRSPPGPRAEAPRVLAAVGSRLRCLGDRPRSRAGGSGGSRLSAGASVCAVAAAAGTGASARPEFVSGRVLHDDLVALAA